jgi:hypothetical protein
MFSQLQCSEPVNDWIFVTGTRAPERSCHTPMLRASVTLSGSSAGSHCAHWLAVDLGRCGVAPSEQHHSGDAENDVAHRVPLPQVRQ